MAVKENGAPVNGSTSKFNRQQPPSRPRERSPAKRSVRGTSAWIMSTSARLLIWYIFVTSLFRCPSSSTGLNESSPRLCKPYLATVYYLKPYTDPYVELARPYADQLDRRVITPATQLTKQNYETYAAPRIATVKAYSQHEWDAIVLPQVEAAHKKANEIYGASIAPSIEKTLHAVGPYYGAAKDKAAFAHENHVLPALETSKPYLHDAYTTSELFLRRTAIPYAMWAWSSTTLFVEGILWPRVRALYGDNVKPQLVMISERIAKYQEGRKIKEYLKEAESSISAISATISDPTQAETPQIISDTADHTDEPTADKTKLSGQEKIAAARPKVAADLNSWQEKFATAADKGAEDLQERVSEIIVGLIKSEVDTKGQGLFAALGETTEKELANYKSEIAQAVAGLQDGSSSSDEDAAQKQLQASIRGSANNIREKASAVRDWHVEFENMVVRRASLAAESTVDVLNGIRDLGLQEIGMRWAWMDGITYKDWAKYHELKKQLEKWRDEVRDIAIKHEMIDQAKRAADTILDNAMETASDAAAELVRLKDVAKWKIQARDPSDSFESRAMPADDPSASSMTDGELPASKSSGSEADDVADVALDAVSSVDTRPQEGLPEAVALNEAPVRAATSALSSDPLADDGSVQSIFDPISEDAAASVGTTEDLAPSAQSVGNHPTDSTEALEVSSAPEAFHPEQAIAESAIGVNEPHPPEASPSAYRKVGIGAMAQEVSAREPILDDVVDDSDGSTFSENLQGIVNQAGDNYAEVTRAVREALLGPSQGPMQSVSSLAGEQYLSALATASKILYGSSQYAGERMTSIATDKYSQAVSAASAALSPTPTPASQSLASHANAAYNDAVSRARLQYLKAQSALSAQISGRPLDLGDEVGSSIDSAYVALEAASRHYAFLTNTAKHLASRPTQGVLESVSSVASANLQDTLSKVSAQYASAKESVGPTPTPLQQQYLQDVAQRYYAAKGLAHEQYADFVSAASTAVYGSSPSTMDAVSRAASQAAFGISTPVFSSISGAASQAVYGTPDPAYQTALSQASSQFLAASSVAVLNLESFLASRMSALGSTAGLPSGGLVDQASVQYSLALAAASSSLSAAMDTASSAMYGTPTGAIESVASQASDNWEALISKASEQIYGAPTPVFASLVSQADHRTSQITEAAALQYANLQAIVSELVIGKEADFTESVMSRLSLAYHTGYHMSLASSASSLAGEAYDSASSVASSVSSVASSASSTYFTPPPQIESILDAASQQLDAAVGAASVQIYGTSKGVFEQAKSAAVESYSSVSSAASQNVYGTPIGNAEMAQSSLSNALSSAQEAISIAIYGTPTGNLESISSVAIDTYSSASSLAVEATSAAGEAASNAYLSAAAKVSEAIYGPEQDAMESARDRLISAAQSAQARLIEFASSAGHTASEAAEAAQRNAGELGDSVSSAASRITGPARDEL